MDNNITNSEDSITFSDEIEDGRLVTVLQRYNPITDKTSPVAELTIFHQDYFTSSEISVFISRKEARLLRKKLKQFIKG